MSFTSPGAALLGIKGCLASMSKRIHTGSLGSGEGLPCCCDDCEGPMIRVESSTTRPKDGVASLYRLSRNRCEDLILDVVVVYRVCWNPFDGDGPEAIDIDNATEEGMGLVASWWDALGLLTSCEATNQVVRFSSAANDNPDGDCFGWTMYLEADLSLCGAA